MKTLPHKPAIKVFEALKSVLDQEIAKDSEARDQAVAAEDGQALMKSGENLIVRGMIGYLYDEPLPDVARRVRRGLAYKRDAVEAGKFLNPYLLWDYLLFALAVNDRESADFFASIPQTRWWSADPLPITWFVNRSRALVALYLGREKEAARHVENSTIQVFEEDLPQEVQEEIPDIQYSVLLLRGLLLKDVALFQSTLENREKWRTERFGIMGNAVPRALIDLDGLGLCRMARDRSLDVAIESPYLPLKLIDVK